MTIYLEDIYNAIGGRFEHLEFISGPKDQCTTVALETLGCKLNQAETEVLASQLKEAGCRIIPASEPADIYILNTCTVTHVADRKARHCLRMARRRNPESSLIVTGCYTEQAKIKLSGIDGVILVAGNEEKHNLVRILHGRGLLKNPAGAAEVDHFNRTRSFIKAQDGCNNFCTYCIVPHVRGREKSVRPEQVIEEINHKVTQGYQEVVLTGTEIGRYNYEGVNLTGLLRNILAESSISRLRLSSIQPPDLTPELTWLWENRRLCRHFHLALQSGSDTVLRRMNRRYNTTDYTRAVEYLRSRIPDVAITTDIITGFPGETPLEFEESLKYVQEMEFARIHVFPYSPREGTPAARMKDQVGYEEKKERNQRMLVLAQTSRSNYQQRHLNRSLEVLFEKASGDIWSGYTDTYIKVYARSKTVLTNRIVPVRLVELARDGVWGEII